MKALAMFFILRDDNFVILLIVLSTLHKFFEDTDP